MSARVLALIPARGGSKSIPDKNLVDLGGHPLIAYSIRAAAASGAATRVLVSTDSERIARVAKGYGAEVPFLRPAELSRDDSTDHGFFRHALDFLREREHWVPDLVLHLRPTTPFRDPAVVARAVAALEAAPAMDSLRSVHPFGPTPYKLFMIRDGALSGFFPDHPEPEYHNLPRQAFPQTYEANGYADVIRPEPFLRTGRLHGRILPFVLPEAPPDIDTPEDLERAREMLRARPELGLGSKEIS